MLLRMKGKLGLRKIIKEIGSDSRIMIERISSHYSRRVEGISHGFGVTVSTGLAVILSYVIISIFNVPHEVKVVIMVGVCAIVASLLAFRPRLMITVVCIAVLFIGVTFIVGSINKEIIEEIGWDPILLGTGTSLIAIAIALYALIIQIWRKEDVVNISDSNKGMSDLKKGYVWLEEIKKYRCEYCKSSGKYYYCKTLGGIKRHIASKHV